MKTDAFHLGHIVRAIQDIQSYVRPGPAIFFSDRMCQDAVIRKLEIIGEAVKALSSGAKAQAPEIPWRRIAGMRDRLIHGYFGVDLRLVWAVVEHELPRLAEAIQRINQSYPGSE